MDTERYTMGTVVFIRRETRGTWSKLRVEATRKRKRRNAQKRNRSSAGTNARLLVCFVHDRRNPVAHGHASSRVIRVSSTIDRAQGPGRIGFPAWIAMESLISLVNKLQRACTALGDHGEDSALPTLWDSLPTIAVVGGQVTTERSRICLVLRRDFFFFRTGDAGGFGLLANMWCGTLAFFYARLVVSTSHCEG